MTDTIVAPATPPGRGGVAVLRVSGPATMQVIDTIIQKKLSPRLANLAHIRDDDGSVIDEVLAIYFPNPASFTGEDVLEIHCHGGPVIVDSIMSRCLASGCRLAKPGEFTERAFLNDKMDLIQAEAVADMIDAHSKHAAKAAMQSLQGHFSTRINTLNTQVIQLRMYVEAAIDFPEEEIDFLADESLHQKLKLITEEFVHILSAAQSGKVLREGIKLVIVGLPNAGKSSLINALVEREIAIVTHIEGTTRDLLREEISINGLPVQIVDTAGIRDANDIVESIGIDRAWDEVQEADLVILLRDATQVNEVILNSLDLSDWELASDIQNRIPTSSHLILVNNKIDSLQVEPLTITKDINILPISAKFGMGIEKLKTLIHELSGYHNLGESSVLARKRHIECIENAQRHVGLGVAHLKNSRAGELLAEELRLAHQYLSQMTGEFTSDDLLGEIFSNFCIGK